MLSYEEVGNRDNPDNIALFLHGVGSNSSDLISLAPEFMDVLPNTWFVSADAPEKYDMIPFEMESFYSKSYQWFSLKDVALGKDFFSRDIAKMLVRLNKAADILKKFVEELLSKQNLPHENLILIGFSQGTMVALHATLAKGLKCRAVVGYSGALIAEELNNTRTKFCLIHGNDDEVVPAKATKLAAEKIKTREIAIESHLLPNLPHSIDYRGIEIAKSFLTGLELPHAKYLWG